MRKFRITGIDRDSGYETTIIVEAGDPNLAEMEALRRGVAVRSCERFIDPNHVAGLLERAMDECRSGVLGGGGPSDIPGPSGGAHRPSISIHNAAPRRREWRLWSQIATGVCLGLIGFTVFIFVVLPALFGTSSSTRVPVRPSQSEPKAAPIFGDWFELVDAGFRMADETEYLAFVAWKIDVENVSRSAQVMGRIRIQFLDREGFELNSDYVYNYRFVPGMNSVSGRAMMDPAAARRIATIQVFTSK